MPLEIGDRAPRFMARSSKNENLRLEHLAGRFIVLTFIEGSARAAHLDLAQVLRAPNTLFDDKQAMHFFVVIGESGEVKDGLGAQIPGHRIYFDKAGEIAAQFGVGRETAKPISFLLSPRQQIIDVFRASSAQEHGEKLLKSIQMRHLGAYEATYGSAPVLRVPFVLEGDLCRDLFQWVMPFFAGLTAEPRLPPDFLSEKDLRRLIRLEQLVHEETLQEKTIRRLMNRVIPEVQRAFNFHTEHLEDPFLTLMRARDKARCDPMQEDGYPGGAHKRFCVAILVHASGEGGEFSFPEFGASLKSLRQGEALVYSAHLLREIKPMRHGEQLILMSSLGVPPKK